MRAYAATRCSRNGRWSASAWATSGTTGTRPDSTSTTSCQAEAEVDPSTSSTRGAGESGATQPS